MSEPRKKLSGAENRKRARKKIEEANQTASKMRRWLHDLAGASFVVDCISAAR